MAPINHRAQVGALVDVLVLLGDRVDPPRHGDTWLVHGVRRVLRLEPLQIQVPDPRPVREGARRHAVVAWQRIRVRADVRSPLHVVVAAVNVAAAARAADVSESEHEDRVRAHAGVTVGVLCLPHGPDNHPGAVLGHDLRAHAAGSLDDRCSRRQFARGSRLELDTKADLAARR